MLVLRAEHCMQKLTASCGSRSEFQILTLFHSVSSRAAHWDSDALGCCIVQGASEDGGGGSTASEGDRSEGAEEEQDEGDEGSEEDDKDGGQAKQWQQQARAGGQHRQASEEDSDEEGADDEQMFRMDEKIAAYLRATMDKRQGRELSFAAAAMIAVLLVLESLSGAIPPSHPN